ncbi:MAG TPA: Smr/MutS family protein [Blastocatellia bacterium]
MDMVLDFLMKRLRRARRVDRPQQSSASIDEDDEVVDPMNPFPDPVIIEFKDVLDLHSIPPRQARAVVEDYLEEAHRLGFQWIRIIHGKGIGAQRQMIRSILARSRFVADFKDAPPEAGGWGATVVTLENGEQ